MKKTSPVTVFLAFLVVALPLGWGLYRSVKNSMPLFSPPPPLPTLVAPASAPATK